MSDDMKDKDTTLRIMAQAILDHGLHFTSGIVDISAPSRVVCRYCNADVEATMRDMQTGMVDPVHEPGCIYMTAERTLLVLNAREGPKPTMYYHLFSLGFSVTTPHKAEDVTAQELLDALHNRFLALDNSDTDEIVEACGPPDDTEEVD